MTHTYILKLADKSYYIGIADDLDKRFSEHMNGRVKYTKSRLPAQIVYFEKYDSRKEARKREIQIKGWKSRKAVERLIYKAN